MLRLRKAAGRVRADVGEFFWAAVVFLVYFAAAHFVFGVSCPQLALTGIPCAGCGLTRAFFCLVKGRIGQAAQTNPSVFPVLAFGLYWGYFRYVKGKKPAGFGAALGLLAVCMLGVYGCRMYLYFPGRAPYIYYEKNILARLFPGYGGQVLGAFDWLKSFLTPGA